MTSVIGYTKAQIDSLLGSSGVTAAARPWVANTHYAAGQAVINPSGDIVTANADHISASTYAADASYWTLSSTYAQNADNLAHLASAATARTNLGLGGAATHPASDFSGSAAGTAGKPLAATDASTTNARTPTAHASTHGSAGSDPVSLDASQVASGTFGLARIPAHASTHGNGGTDLLFLPVNAKLDYGAKGDAKTVSGGSITSGTNTLTASGFASTDVGKAIAIVGAGASGATLVTTISGYTSSTQVTLTANASTTVASASVTWGTDDTTALQNFITYCITNNRLGRIPGATYLITSTLNFSYRPSWGIGGDGYTVTTIQMATDNTPIFNMGSDTASLAHHFYLGGFSLTYVGLQTGNTNATCMLFNQMFYEGKIEKISFDGGYDAVKVTSGIGCPWGITWDELTFGGNLCGSCMDWSNGANGTPNNHFGRMYVSGANMTKAAFNLRGYNFRVDSLEFTGMANGVALFVMNAQGHVDIGTMKLENGTYNPGAGNSVNLFSFPAGCTANIGHITTGGSALYVTSGTVYCVATPTNPTTGIVRVGYISATLTSAPSGGGAYYIVGATSPVIVDRYDSTNATGLCNYGGSTASEVTTVTTHANRQLSANKGDASYTVALGDPTRISYQTALTAPRTVTLPSNTFLFNGLTYEVIVDGAAPTGTNTLTIMSGSRTLATITTDKVVYGFTCRRNSALDMTLNWTRTKYETMP